MKFMVYDRDSETKRDFIGQAETTMGKLFGAPKQTFLATLTLEG